MWILNGSLTKTNQNMIWDFKVEYPMGISLLYSPVLFTQMDVQ